jgi:hypothetical protein
MSIETVLLIVILTFGLGFVLNRWEGEAGYGAAVCAVVSGDGAAHDRLRRVTTRRRQAELASSGTGLTPG